MHIAHLLPVAGRVLVCGPNWLGDSLMCMPTLQVLNRRYPACRFAVLVKPGLEPLWRMHGAADECIEMGTTLPGVLRSAARVRERHCDGALVFPNSFRSALVPYLARVPVRVGLPGHGRVWMLTNVVRRPVKPERCHQVWEYLEIAGLADRMTPEDLEPPRLQIQDAARADMAHRVGLRPSMPTIGLIPGAARGPSKQWPPECFTEVGKRLATERRCRILVLGTKKESSLCRRVAEAIGPAAISLGGETTLAEFAACLSICRVVVANDSGGMHLAAAAGSRVVAVFGLTDPSCTGLLGKEHRVIVADGERHARDIERDSREAREALESIPPAQVCSAVFELLEA